MSGPARGYVVHPLLRSEPQGDRDAAARLDEALRLSKAVELEIVGGEVAPVGEVRPSTLFRGGKIEELKAGFAANDIDVVIVNASLSPSQQRNLERAWERKVLDRTGLILEIFGARAQTREGVLQVELAHLAYQRSRLVRSWTHLERQRGGAGFMGGPGETQIEADRRIIDDRIVRLKKQLETVTRTRSLHRAARSKVPYPIVALVGYTNAGKSTLFNRLTNADVFAKDMLFATLDPTMRSIALPSGEKVILSDTVGFISDLPTQLIAAFRATLEEVLAADLIVHVRDAASAEAEPQKSDVLKVLDDLGVEQSRLDGMIEALNKSDLMDPEARAGWRNAADRDPSLVLFSAETGEGVEALLATIETALSAGRLERQVRLPLDDGAARAWLREQGAVVDERFEDGVAVLDLKLSTEDAGRFVARFPDLPLT